MSTALRLLTETARAGLRLSVVGENTLRVRPAERVTADLRQTLVDHKPALLALLERLEAAAGPDWPELQADPETLAAFARAMLDREARERGERPEGWTQAATCERCGPVWLWVGAPEVVAACPWCFNRLVGRPLPRPAPVVCAECEQFTPDPAGHGGIGRCAIGADPDPTGPPLYPRVTRRCSSFTPHREEDTA